LGSSDSGTDFSIRRVTTSDGLILVADIAGEAGHPAVILLHGGGQTRHSWAGAMRRLATEGYQVISYDARGHGESDWSPRGDYTLPSLAADLRAVFSTIDAPAALVGASMGGMTSFYAIGSSERPMATALVMVDIVLRPNIAGTKKIWKFMQSHADGFASLEEAADAVTQYNPHRPRPADLDGLRKNLRMRDDKRLYWHWDPRLLAADPSIEPPSFSNELVGISDRVDVPLLLVRGGQSDVVDDTGVAEMLALVPQMEIVNVPGAGHMVAGDRNDTFVDGILPFLRRAHPANR
jgi:pimeloyl-ACP methyl ester carboxylesterase